MMSINRAGWPAGPWLAEPEDVVTWEAHGLPCELRRQGEGYWCGYVALPKEHLFFGAPGELANACLDVHGGITYAQESPPGWVFEGAWRLGWDALHGGDLAPGMPTTHGRGTYRTLPWCRRETERLAEQLAIAGELAEAFRAELGALYAAAVGLPPGLGPFGPVIAERVRRVLVEGETRADVGALEQKQSRLHVLEARLRGALPTFAQEHLDAFIKEAGLAKGEGHG